MRKVLYLLSALFLIFLVACDEEAGEEGANEVIEEEQQDETEDDKDDLDEEATDAEVDEMESDTNREEEDHTSVNDKNDQSIANEGEDESIQQLGERIIQAQMDEDYNFLNSIIADGVVIDEANNTIEFDTEEASHTFDFVTGIKNEDLEFRFVDGEDTDQAIVGFAAIDYENEYSYVIEMIFDDIDGKWKLTSIDINK